MKRILTEAKKLIEISSICEDGNEALANHLVGFLEDRGLQVRLQHVTHSIEGISRRQFNVIGILGDSLVDRKTKKGLLFCSQLDTTSAGVQDYWEQNPLDMRVDGSVVTGLGVTTKLDILSKIYAIEKFRERKLRCPIYFVGTCGSTFGGFGAQYLIESVALNPKAVVVGDSTELGVVSEMKNSLKVQFSIRFQQIERDAGGFNRKIDFYSLGKIASSVEPQNGVNAIIQLLDFIERAKQEGFEFKMTGINGGMIGSQVPDRAHGTLFLRNRQFEDFKHYLREAVMSFPRQKAFKIEIGALGDSGVLFLPPNLFECLKSLRSFMSEIEGNLEQDKTEGFDPDHSTICWTRLVQSHNQVTAEFDLHLNPKTDLDSIKLKFEEQAKILSTLFPDLKISAEVVQRMERKPFQGSSEIKPILSEALQDVGLSPEEGKKSCVSEAVLFERAGYDTVSFGPGSKNNNRGGPNENISLDDLEKASQLYRKLIERFCLS